MQSNSSNPSLGASFLRRSAHSPNTAGVSFDLHDAAFRRFVRERSGDCCEPGRGDRRSHFYYGYHGMPMEQFVVCFQFASDAEICAVLGEVKLAGIHYTRQKWNGLWADYAAPVAA